MINANGDMYRCGSYGQGIYGVAQANQIQGDCLTSMRAAGYIEIEKAGVVGIIYSQQLSTDTLVTILKVAPKSPAETAGIRSGDILLAVDGIKVRKNTDASMLLFGNVGTTVSLSISSNGKITNMNINRDSYTRVYGKPKNTK